MKQVYSILIMLAFCCVHAGAQEGWTKQIAPFTGGLSGVYALDSLSVWAVGQNGLIIHTSDGGSTWDSISNGATKSIYTVEFLNADTGFVAGRDNGSTPWTNGLLQRTVDGGQSWEFVDLPGGNQNSVMDIDFVEGPPGEPMRGVCVGGLAHVWTSYNYGESWEAASGDCGEGNFNSCFFNDSITGWFVGTPSNVKPYTIMFTNDACQSFVEQTDPLEIKLNGVSFGTNLKGVAVGNAGTVLYTSDGGANWVQSSDEDILGTTWFSVVLSETGLAWAAGNDGRIAYSEDWGQTWTAQVSGVSDPLWEVYFINDNEGWIVGGFSENVILHTKNGGVSSTGLKDYEGDDGGTFGLEQNYPNPFSSSTQISYRLTCTCHITLSVFDLSGRKIQTLVNEFQSGGRHVLSYDADHLNPGLYFYQLKIDKKLVAVKKMILER